MNKTQFINYLKDGGRVRMVSYRGGDVGKNLNSIREAEKIQTNGVKFTGGSWLMWDDFKASDISMTARNIISLGWCEYELLDMALY